MRTLRLSKPAILVALSLAISISLTSSPPTPAPRSKLVASTGAWTVYHHDDAHTGSDLSLPPVTSVSAGWVSAAFDGEVYGSPLIYNGIVYTATLNNTVYALNQSNGTEIWHTNLGAPATGGWQCGDVSPQGIVGTPVIDVAGGRIYVAAFFADHTYHVVGLSLTTGVSQLNTTLNISGFTWQIEQERGALAVHNGYVYVPFGGRAGDCFLHNPPNPDIPYHGYIVAVPTSGTGTPPVFQTPSSGGAGVWAAGGVVVDDTSNNVFISVGNAIPCDGVSDSVIRLSPTLTSPTSFQPSDWAPNWCAPDSDLGSASPLLISPNLMFTAGKRGGGFLLDPTNLGGVNGQLFPARSPYVQADVCAGQRSDATFGSFAYAAPYVYLECESPTGGLGLMALNVNTSTPSFTACSATCPAPNWRAGGSTSFGPPIVAAGAVWAASNGGLSAFNAATGALIYQSASFGINRFVTPAEAGGSVYVPSRTVIRSFNMGFTSIWTSLGGAWTSGPDASSWASNRADVFIRGTDNALWQTTWNGSTWSSATSLGGVLAGDPGAVAWGPNRIDVFVRGSDNQMWHKFMYGGGQWSSGWEAQGGVLSSGPDVASWAPGRLDVFVRGTDNALWHRWWDGSRWNGWESLGGVLASDPTAVSWGPGRLDLFVRGTDNQMWHKSYQGGWSGWEGLGGTLTSAPDAASCGPGRLDIFATGAGSALMRLGFNGAWNSWSTLGGTWTSEPGAVCLTNTSTIDLFERGTDNALWQANVPSS